MASADHFKSLLPVMLQRHLRVTFDQQDNIVKEYLRYQATAAPLVAKRTMICATLGKVRLLCCSWVLGLQRGCCLCSLLAAAVTDKQRQQELSTLGHFFLQRHCY